MCLPGLGISDNVPGANMLWTSREVLKTAGAMEDLFKRFDEAPAASASSPRKPSPACASGCGRPA
jgi:hypothetical protein